jgi:tellurite resistance protein TerC
VDASSTEGIELVHLLATAEASADFADLDVTTWQWVALVALIGALLAVDLVAHRGDHVPTARRALVESSIWVLCGLAFAGLVLVVWGGGAFGEYLSGYVIEKSLGIDNVFVWAIVFSSFAIPARYQHRVLFWGVFGALVLRAAFILGGTAVIEQFSWVLVVFGVVLVASGIKVVRHRDDEGTQGHDRAVRLLSRFMPVQRELAGHHFAVRTAGRWVATPLLAALVVVEVTDIVFAVDSVPAILAVSREPFIVFASNAFAILGLRAMYFLLGDAKQRFHYLSHALGAILVFVGVKMLVSPWFHVPTPVSLAAIVALLGAAVVLSVRRSRRVDEAAAARTSTPRDPSVRRG